MTDFAIQVLDLHKDFLLPHLRQTSVKHLIMRQHRPAVEAQHVLDGISFEVPRGGFFGIVGRNGSGKSTLLKVLAGIYQATGGSVRTNGSIVPLIELGVGFNPELTGRENVFLSGAVSGIPRGRMAAMYDDIVEFAGLERFMDQKLKNYSSGMLVRLAFSLAIRAEADILLLDEVLAVGDADFQRKCLAYFSDLKESDTTVVLVTHSMDAVRQYCDNAILIESGKVLAEGSAEDVARAYTQLFSATDYEETRKPGEPWGNGHLVIDAVTVRPSFTEDDEHVDIAVDVRPTASQTPIEYGFVIRDRAGRQVLGTAGATAGDAEGYVLTLDDPARLTWRFPNILGVGDYSVTASAVDRLTGVLVAEWEYAAHFSVYRDPNTALPVIPRISLQVD